MEIRIRETGQVMFEGEFRARHIDTSLPAQLTTEVLDALGADVVLEGPQPQPGRYQVAHRDGVEQIDGQWFTKYSLADMDDETKATADERQVKAVRYDRDRRLAETDWRFRSDMNPSQEWKDYCQALRDVPAQAGFPWTIVWPDKP